MMDLWLFKEYTIVINIKENNGGKMEGETPEPKDQYEK